MREKRWMVRENPNQTTKGREDRRTNPKGAQRPMDSGEQAELVESLLGDQTHALGMVTLVTVGVTITRDVKGPVDEHDGQGSKPGLS